MIGFFASTLSSVYSSKDMAEVFSGEQQYQAWLDFESGLARAQARLGMVPAAAAEEISRRAHVDQMDLARYEALLQEMLHPIMPMVTLLSQACDEQHGEYVHWGATTQDVMDTGLVLQLRQAHRLMHDAVARLVTAMEQLADRYAETPMAGRTHAQHAVPVTLGYKFAVYVDELRRQLHELDRAAEETQVVQFGGAAGTLASLGLPGLDVRRELAAELELREPDITWHVARDRLARYAFYVSAISAVVQRFAREVVTLQRPEIAELEEPFHMGKVGSSTMPHKRNPSISEIAWSLGELACDQFRTMLTSLTQEHERDMAVWQLEWDALPRLLVLAHRAVDLGGQVAEGLTVNEAHLERNLRSTNGFISSEAVMMTLATNLGRQTSHDIVYEVAMRSVADAVPFDEALRKDERAQGVGDQLEAALDPARVVNAAIAQARALSNGTRGGR